MNKFLILTASTMTLALASPALASSEGGYCGNVTGQWMSPDDVKAMVTEMGYTVRRIKTEDGCYEAYAVDKNGARSEIYIHPVTGEIVKTKGKSRS